MSVRPSSSSVSVFVFVNPAVFAQWCLRAHHLSQARQRGSWVRGHGLVVRDRVNPEHSTDVSRFGWSRWPNSWACVSVGGGGAAKMRRLREGCASAVLPAVWMRLHHSQCINKVPQHADKAWPESVTIEHGVDGQALVRSSASPPPCFQRCWPAHHSQTPSWGGQVPDVQHCPLTANPPKYAIMWIVSAVLARVA